MKLFAICIVVFFFSLSIFSPLYSQHTASPESGKEFVPGSPEEQLLYSRAFQAVIWAMPAVNTELLLESLTKTGGECNQMIYWSNRVTSKNQTLTPNPDVIYFNPMYDTRKGPVVLDIPAANGPSSITGSIDDSWQTAIEDLGPAGFDKGHGGKYLILPPNYNGTIPNGYIPLRSSTYTGFVILRSNLTNGNETDINRAVQYGKKVKIYPYENGGNQQAMPALDLLQKDLSNVIPYNLHFFESLNSFIQREPWLERDMAMIDPLKTLGIQKGKSFNPDRRTKEILTQAIVAAHKWINQKYENIFNTPYYENTYWALPAYPELIKAISSNYADHGDYPIDARGVTYSMAYFSAKQLGGGQYYLMTIKDKNGNRLDGSKQYKLHLPANVPVNLYWSVTLYDGDTHAFLKGVTHYSKSSATEGIMKNKDGSYDLYFGPTPPVGKETNWVPTDPNKNFEVLARFYGPEKTFYDKVWKMGNVEIEN